MLIYKAIKHRLLILEPDHPGGSVEESLSQEWEPVGSIPIKRRLLIDKHVAQWCSVSLRSWR